MGNQIPVADKDHRRQKERSGFRQNLNLGAIQKARGIQKDKSETKFSNSDAIPCAAEDFVPVISSPIPIVMAGSIKKEEESRSPELLIPGTPKEIRDPSMTNLSDSDEGISEAEELTSAKPPQPFGVKRSSERGIKCSLSFSRLFPPTEDGEQRDPSRPRLQRPADLQVGPSLKCVGTSSKLDEERKVAKLHHYAMVCSEILPFIFVSGRIVAADKSKLEMHRITYVLNASLTHCPNYFEQEKNKFSYLGLRFHDSKEEEISWVMYQAFDFIESARLNSANVLIHCIEGVSRSCAICIAYLMWSQKMSYDQAFKFVREQRGICSPNLAFHCQLLEWQKLQNEHPGFPLLFRISPHGVHDRETYVMKTCRDLEHRELIPASAAALDPRGVFIVWPKDSLKLYVWKGKDHTALQASMINKAVEWARVYENGPQTADIISQGEESDEFWNNIGGKKPVLEHSLFTDLLLLRQGSSTSGSEQAMDFNEDEAQPSHQLYQLRRKDDVGYIFEHLRVYDLVDLE